MASEVKDPDPIDMGCEKCGALYTLYQRWKQPVAEQSLACEKCGHIVWRNMGGKRTNSETGVKYNISSELQGTLRKRVSRKAEQDKCKHDYQKERIMGADTGDLKCTKCGHVKVM